MNLWVKIFAPSVITIFIWGGLALLVWLDTATVSLTVVVVLVGMQSLDRNMQRMLRVLYNEEQQRLERLLRRPPSQPVSDHPTDNSADDRGHAHER